MDSKSVIKLTPNAAQNFQRILEKDPQNPVGFRISTENRGCNGMKYSIVPVYDDKAHNEKTIIAGITLFIDPLSIMFLAGMEIDYQENDLESGFIFRNPNAKSTCGCGESFTA